MNAKAPIKGGAKAVPANTTAAAPAAPPTTPEVQPSEQPTATYVVGTCPVLHNGKSYQPGFDIELTEAEAARLGDLVRQVPTSPEPPLE